MMEHFKSTAYILKLVWLDAKQKLDPARSNKPKTKKGIICSCYPPVFTGVIVFNNNLQLLQGQKAFFLRRHVILEKDWYMQIAALKGNLLCYLINLVLLW